MFGGWTLPTLKPQDDELTFIQFQPSCCFLVYGFGYNVCEQDRLKPKRQISLKYQQVCWTLYHSDVKCFTPMWIQKWCKLELSSRADGIREASQRYSWEVSNARYEGWITLIQTIVLGNIWINFSFLPYSPLCAQFLDITYVRYILAEVENN